MTSSLCLCVDILCLSDKVPIQNLHPCTKCKSCLHSYCGNPSGNEGFGKGNTCYKCCIETGTWIGNPDRRQAAHEVYKRLFPDKSIPEATPPTPPPPFSSANAATSASATVSATMCNAPSTAISKAKKKSSTTSRRNPSSTPSLPSMPTDLTKTDPKIQNITKTILLDIKQNGGLSKCLKYGAKRPYMDGLATRLGNIFRNEYRPTSNKKLIHQFMS